LKVLLKYVSGTIEKPLFCSAAPECEHKYRLPEEAELHSIANKRCSPSAEQLPLGLQSLFSQESHDSMEHGALASAISHTESGVDQLKVCHVKCTVEATTVSQPISHLDTHLATGTDEVEGTKITVPFILLFILSAHYNVPCNLASSMM
jgi:hypothetical protein